MFKYFTANINRLVVEPYNWLLDGSIVIPYYLIKSTDRDGDWYRFGAPEIIWTELGLEPDPE